MKKRLSQDVLESMKMQNEPSWEYGIEKTGTIRNLREPRKWMSPSPWRNQGNQEDWLNNKKVLKRSNMIRSLEKID
eukprot:CAMPEP_0170558348 /NCGR_PEP_ID=MMETSP0211-20121228/34649_1 /TAXON_ID=311385 /ORGANISM="Pseudokeronopsis sp., Strain OXSARD2" /LENGTH=75 /DNA_ID=CAMNT_0010870197 /DNA_START=154 /DNA_END=381 /DNA_ORIENTATION=-